MALLAGEQSSGGQVLDTDGRLIVVGPGGVAIGGGGGGAAADPLSDGTPGGALPSKTLWIAGANGAVLQGLVADATGRLRTVVEGTPAVSVSNFPAAQAVSDGGGSLTVDGTVTANAGTGPWPVTDNGVTLSVDDGAGSLTVDGSVSVSNFPASQAVTGTFFQATQPVSGTVGLAAGTNNVGDVDVLTLPSLPAGANQIGTTLGPAITKGTQGATGYTTQNLKDAGRNGTHYSANFVSATATDALVSLTGYKGNAAVAATTTPAVVTAGKTYRVQAIYCNYFGVATLGAILVKLRANTAGVVAIGSPVVWQWIVGTTVAGAGVVSMVNVDIPDGLEFAAGTGIGISILGLNTAGAAAAAGALGIQIAGFEF